MVPKYHLPTPIAMVLSPARSLRRKQWLSHSVLLSVLKDLKHWVSELQVALTMRPQRRTHAPIQLTCHPLSVDILPSYLYKRISGTYTLNLHSIFTARNWLTLIPLQRYYDNSTSQVDRGRWASPSTIVWRLQQYWKLLCIGSSQEQRRQCWRRNNLRQDRLQHTRATASWPTRSCVPKSGGSNGSRPSRYYPLILVWPRSSSSSAFNASAVRPWHVVTSLCDMHKYSWGQ